MVVKTLCPDPCWSAVVEGLPRDRLSHRHAECLATLGEHLARKQRHLEVEFYSQTLAQIRYCVETAAVFSLDIHRDEVAMMLDGFFHDGGLPFEIHDFALDAS